MELFTKLLTFFFSVCNCHIVRHFGRTSGKHLLRKIFVLKNTRLDVDRTIHSEGHRQANIYFNKYVKELSAVRGQENSLGRTLTGKELGLHGDLSPIIIGRTFTGKFTRKDISRERPVKAKVACSFLYWFMMQ